MKSFKKYSIVIALVFIVFLAVSGLNLIDHSSFKTVQTGEITVLKSGSFPVFVPEGAYVVGDLHQFVDGDIIDNNLSEGILKKEYLVKTKSKAVVYWSLDQKAAAEKMLQN